jgi:hypothetical protein
MRSVPLEDGRYEDRQIFKILKDPEIMVDNSSPLILPGKRSILIYDYRKRLISMLWLKKLVELPTAPLNHPQTLH